MADTLLDIVNEDDQIIGQALRSEVHAKGLLHREIIVWFITPDKDLIFQKRSLSKDRHPGLLSPTVSGHVEAGDDYQKTAIKESLEEACINIAADKLIFLGIKHYKSVEEASGRTNNVMRAFYGFVYDGKMEDLKVEQEDGDGFEKFPLKDIFNLSDAARKKIIPSMLNKEKYGFIYEALDKLVS